MEVDEECTEWPPRTLVTAVLSAMVSREPATEVAVMSAARRLSMAVVSAHVAEMAAYELNMPWSEPVMAYTVVELESSSQASAALVAVMEVAPKRRPPVVPTPHELVPTHEESCWKWWMASNIVLREWQGGRGGEQLRSEHSIDLAFRSRVGVVSPPTLFIIGAGAHAG